MTVSDQTPDPASQGPDPSEISKAVTAGIQVLTDVVTSLGGLVGAYEGLKLKIPASERMKTPEPTPPAAPIAVFCVTCQEGTKIGFFNDDTGTWIPYCNSHLPIPFTPTPASKSDKDDPNRRIRVRGIPPVDPGSQSPAMGPWCTCGHTRGTHVRLRSKETGDIIGSGYCSATWQLDDTDSPRRCTCTDFVEFSG